MRIVIEQEGARLVHGGRSLTVDEDALRWLLHCGVPAALAALARQQPSEPVVEPEQGVLPI